MQHRTSWRPTRLALVSFSLVLGMVVPTQAPKRSESRSATSVPVLTSITPNTFPNDTNMRVTIAGSGFDAAPRVELGEVHLRNVEVTGGISLTALVPWGLPVGVYTLTLTNVDDQSAQLSQAVTVTAGTGTWTSHGPYGGTIDYVTLDPVNPSRLYASAGRSGVWKSQDGGTGWELSFVAPFPYEVKVVYPTPGQAPVLYVGGDGGLGMQRSLDSGQTWATKVPAAFNTIQSTGGAQGRPYLQPGHPDRVYLGLNASNDLEPLGGLYKSVDRGDSWTPVTGTLGLHITALAFDPAQPDTHLVLGTRDGKVYTSTDGGATWGSGMSVAGYIGGLVYAPHLYNGQRSLWAITNDADYEGNDTLYRSLDGGLSWAPVTVLPGGFNMGVSYHATIPGLLWSAIGRGYYSTDDGAYWTALVPGLDQVRGFAVLPDSTGRQSTALFAASRTGVYKSGDGGDHWQESDAGLAANMARTIAVSPFNADEAYAATQAKGFLHTWDGGRTWDRLPIPMGRYQASIVPDPFKDGKVYFGYGSYENVPNVRITTDHGATYATLALTMPAEYAGRGAYVSAFVANPKVEKHLLAGVCVGAPWPQVGPGLIYASTDGGATWSQQTTPTSTQCITRLVFDPHDDEVVYAGTDGTGLARSIDGGAVWAFLPHQAMGDGKPANKILALEIDPADSRSIFLSSFGSADSDVGIFASHDGGDTWVKMTGTPYPIWELKFVKVGASYWLYAATMNGLRFLTAIPDDPTAEWQYASGIAAVATVDGFNAAVEEGRGVYYIGTSGGTLPGVLTARGTVAVDAPATQTFSGGIYRHMVRTQAIFLPVVKR
jgi:photosystem II stability/assembly factor-like uncharacterized protein